MHVRMTQGILSGVVPRSSHNCESRVAGEEAQEGSEDGRKRSKKHKKHHKKDKRDRSSRRGAPSPDPSAAAPPQPHPQDRRWARCLACLRQEAQPYSRIQSNQSRCMPFHDLWLVFGS